MEDGIFGTTTFRPGIPLSLSVCFPSDSDVFSVGNSWNVHGKSSFPAGSNRILWPESSTWVTIGSFMNFKAHVDVCSEYTKFTIGRWLLERAFPLKSILFFNHNLSDHA
jgi:hypothetical protein